jgi:hypothetical protein
VLRNGGPPVDAAVYVTGVFTTHATAPGSRFTAITPYRALDSRVTSGALAAGTIRAVTVTGGSTGVPAGATSVLVNLTGVGPSQSTTVMAWPDAGATTVAAGAMLHLSTGDVRANLALVEVGAGGRILLSSVAGTTNVLVDVVGYYL